MWAGAPLGDSHPVSSAVRLRGERKQRSGHTLDKGQGFLTSLCDVIEGAARDGGALCLTLLSNHQSEAPLSLFSTLVKVLLLIRFSEILRHKKRKLIIKTYIVMKLGAHDYMLMVEPRNRKKNNVNEFSRKETWIKIHISICFHTIPVICRRVLTMTCSTLFDLER